MNLPLSMLILLISITHHVHTAVVIQGNDPNAPRGFTVPVSVTAYDPFWGNFFVGLTAQGGTFALARADRPNFMSAPTFTGIATSNILTNMPIEFLTVAQQTTQLSALGTVIEMVANPFTQTQLTALRTDGSQVTQTGSLNDAAGVTTNGIIALTASASPTFFFAAVRPNGGDFGQADGGIALVGVTPTQNTLTLTPKNATTGLPGNQAIALQHDSVQLTGGTNPVIFQTIDATNLVELTWDEQLQRLYIGTLITTGTQATDIAKSVVVGRLDTTANNALILEPIVANSAITPGGNEIIVTQAASQSVSARHIGIMHASTGPDYLIVNGGRDIIDLVGNSIYALPLVNDPINTTVQGTLANKNSPLSSNFVFTQPATAPGDLPTNTDAAAIVGDGTLPIEPADQIAQLLVIGDTIYVALNFAPSAMHSTGIFYSQALFEADGKIIRWTPWTKKASQSNLFPGIMLPGDVMSDGSVLSCAVDTQTGNIIFVEGTTGQVAGITNWNNGSVPTDLTTVLNTLLFQGSYAVLDLDQATRGFQNNTAQRYALFGGLNKVVFARISQAYDDTLLTGPQLVVSDFSSVQNLFSSPLPANSGCIQCLEYSRSNTTEPSNFFFAGTETGLFAFANGGGQGFNVTQLGLLDTNPFTTGAWQKIPAITGSIIDIKTSGAGQTLYILAVQSTLESPLKTTLYSVPFASTLNTMFNPGNIRIIAQTEQDIFSPIRAFYGIQIIATDSGANPENKEQLFLATNKGLFASHADQIIGNGISTALNQTAAAWQLVDQTNGTTFFGVAGIDTPIRSTVWPFSIADDQRGCMLFSRSSIFQISGNGNALGNNAIIGDFVPAQFNAHPLLPAFKTLDPIVYFYSDGARRFFITRQYTQNPNINTIVVIPYRVDLVNQKTPTNLSVAAVTNQRFYWIKEIGVSGLVIAGTGHGVVTLS